MQNNTSVVYESAFSENKSLVTTAHGIGKGLQSKIFGNLFVSVMTLVALYLIASLIAYHVRSKSKINLIFGFHMLTAVATLCSLISEQLELQLGTKADIYCFLYTLLTSSFYFLGVLSTFTLLWYRQRSLYSTSILRAYNGKCWRFLSKYVIVGIHAVFIPSAVLVPGNIKLTSTESGGCILENDENKDIDDLLIVIATLVAFGIFFQVFLLLLFVYPLRRSKSTSNDNQTNQKRRRKYPSSYQACCCCKIKKTKLPSRTGKSHFPDDSQDVEEFCCIENGSSKNSTGVSEAKLPNCGTNNTLNPPKRPALKAPLAISQSEDDREKSSASMVRRLVVCTAVCICSELLSGGIAAICLMWAPDSYWSLIIHADLLVNLLTITFSFVNWRERIFPFGKINPSPPRRMRRTRSDTCTVASIVTGTK